MVSRTGKSSSPRREKGAEKSRSRADRRALRARPLDPPSLRDLALSYVARFATTGARLEAYLARKLRERGVAEDAEGRPAELDIPGLVSDFAARGYIDDASYARSRSRDLTQRGYGTRRVEQALWAAGVEEEVRCEALPGEARAREAALLLARKRRFGLFARGAAGDPLGDEDDADRSPEEVSARSRQREKQIAAMLRAGHDYDHVRFILDADSEAQIEQWISEARSEEPD